MLQRSVTEMRRSRWTRPNESTRGSDTSPSLGGLLVRPPLAYELDLLVEVGIGSRADERPARERHGQHPVAAAGVQHDPPGHSALADLDVGDLRPRERPVARA